MQPPFNPYSAPQYAAQPYYGGAGGPFFARAEGQNLVVSKTAVLPNVCIKCAAREPTPIARRRRNFTFIPWYGRFFGVIGILMTQKKAILEIPICPACEQRRRQAMLVMWLVTLGMIGLTVATFLLGAVANSDAIVGLGVVLVFASIFVPIIVLAAYARRYLFPQATFIDDQVITLGKVHPGAIEAALYAAQASAAQYQQPQYGAPYGPPQPYGQQPWPPR